MKKADCVEAVGQIYTRVWAFRQEFEDYWCFPGPINCLRYAFCELGEAIDARLRAERPEDKRNTVRGVREVDELADAVIMLVSAMGNDWPGVGSANLVEYERIPCLDELAGKIGMLLYYAADPDARLWGMIGWSVLSVEYFIWPLAAELVFYAREVHQTDLVQTVIARLARIKANHVDPFRAERTQPPCGGGLGDEYTRGIEHTRGIVS